jgi:hypothetical protein
MTVTGEVNLGFVAETIPPDSYEPDNFPNDGEFLQPGEVQSRVIHPHGDVDWIKVSALEGHEYTVEALHLVSTWSDTVLEVYDDTGSLITENADVDYYYRRFESRVSWIATYTGTYYVKARTSDGISGHFDDQGGGDAFCCYDISFACSDLDGDGYGDPGSVLCTYPELDCDDSDANIHPGAEEVCNGTDDDCDETTDNVDADLDGYIAEACGGEDCDDSNDQVNPGAAEGPCCEWTCFDWLDNDCDGLTDKFNDPDCSLLDDYTPSAEAAVYGPGAVTGSGALAQVGLFLVPVAQILLLRRCLRRKR